MAVPRPRGAAPQVPPAPGAPQLDLAVLNVPYLADGGHAVRVDAAHLAGGEPDHHVVALSRQELGGAAGTPHELGALPLVHLKVVDDVAGGGAPQRQGGAGVNLRLGPRP